MSAERTTLGRRQFLAALGAGAAVVAAVPAADQASADSESANDKRRSRYRETDHIKAFFRVNRYPS